MMMTTMRMAIMKSKRTERVAPLLLLLQVAVVMTVLVAVGDAATFAQTVDEFDQIVQNQPYALVVISRRAACPSCERYERLLQDNLKEMEDMYQCSLTIVRDSAELEKRYGVDRVPRVMFFREGIPAMYNSAELLPNDLLYWVHQARDARVQLLDDATFEHLTQATTGATTGEWLVAFVSRETPALRAKLEGLQATFMGYNTNVAIVDYDRNVNLQKRFNIKKDTLLFFRSGKMYRFIGSKWDAKALVDFVAQTYRHVKAERIPLESSLFDYVLDASVRFVREHLAPLAPRHYLPIGDASFEPAGAGLAATAVIVAVVVGCCLLRRARKAATEQKPKQQ